MTIHADSGTRPVDDLRGRYYGKYRGVVTQVDSETCRIKANVPAVLDSAETGWCLPCVPYAGKGVGMVFLPEEHSGVWIEFEGGDVSYPIWVGAYWRQGEIPAGVAGNVKVLTTVSGLTLTLDDGTQKLTINDKNGNTVSLSSDGITLSKNGQQIVVSGSSVSVNRTALVVK
jgi:uncharacterized protein involved in type VI secretion and phage assembly